MNCPLCGEICSCHSEPPPTALARWRSDAEELAASVSNSISIQAAVAGKELVDPEAPDRSEEIFSASPEAAKDLERTSKSTEIAESPLLDTKGSGSSAESAAEADSANEPVPQEADTEAWRDELSARLHRYRARRKVRPPRYPSLSLQFDAIASSGSAGPSGGDSLADFHPLSDHALALDGMITDPRAREIAAQTDVAASHSSAVEAPLQTVKQHGGISGFGLSSAAVTGGGATSAGVASAGVGSAKIIEFPRFAWGPPAPPPDQLAEPVIDRPRILEAPEVAPPPPALGGITIEGAERPEAEKRLGIDIPLQSAALARRLFASAIDGLIILAASAMFGGIFWKVAAVRPPLVQIVGLGAAIPCLLWAAYQYLLIVYAAGTPGLHLAKLELARFDGSATSRSLRRWRVLASYLSAASLGMGYAWVFLDEDALCWHDRTTHTYLASGKPHSKREELPRA